MNNSCLIAFEEGIPLRVIFLPCFFPSIAFGIENVFHLHLNALKPGNYPKNTDIKPNVSQF